MFIQLSDNGDSIIQRNNIDTAHRVLLTGGFGEEIVDYVLEVYFHHRTKSVTYRYGNTSEGYEKRNLDLKKILTESQNI